VIWITRARRTAFGDFKDKGWKISIRQLELGLERQRGIWPISFLYIKELLSSLEKGKSILTVLLDPIHLDSSIRIYPPLSTL
jgi:hypothetical protein